MADILLFGGTSEGRELCGHISQLGLSATVCVATQYGESMLPDMDNIHVLAGRKDRDDIAALLQTEKPDIVIDATHPYATGVSDNVYAACQCGGARYIRANRPGSDSDETNSFDSLKEMVEWANGTEGIVFSAMGSKHAADLAAINGYADRVVLRILPDCDALAGCIALGYPPRNIICMQGPFSYDLNVAMFRQTGAKLMLTKDSGGRGGFDEKLRAAKDCDMDVAVLRRPQQHGSHSLEEIKKIIEGLGK